MMKVFQSVLALVILVAVMNFASGCKKKASSEVPAPTAAEPTPGTATTPAPNSPQVAASASTYQEVRSAMETKNYDQAATMMLNMRSSTTQMSPEQAAAYAEQMRNFQQSLAAAAAAGDQRAMEAARRLAQSRHR
jgi:hypothetical protein